jgi:hypothetical protein
VGRKEIRDHQVTHESLKVIFDYFNRLDKDFNYLTHPQKLPRAYEKSLIEVSRRRRFRKLIDDEYKRLKEAIQREKDARNVFMGEYGRLLPSEFIPQLREQTVTLKLEGGNKDYELPEINEDVPGGLELLQGGGSSNSGEDSKKYNELLKE